MLPAGEEAATRPMDGGLPRVLFVTSHAFNHSTGGGVTFSNLFRGWPKDRLATVHNDPTPVATDVCERYFLLERGEIGKWGPFGWLRNRARGSGKPDDWASDGPTDGQAGAVARKPPLAGVRDFLFGAAEFPETARLTPRLRDWISEFRPEVLYTILGANALIDLVDQIRTGFGLPLVVHFMDDWMSTAYSNGALSSPRRRAMQAKVSRMIAAARARMGISEAMCEAYRQRYGVPFAPFQNAVESGRWTVEGPKDRPAANRPFRLFYAGAVLPFAQAESLVDVARAVDALQRDGVPVVLDIYGPPAQTAPYRERLAAGPAVRLHEPLSDHDAYVGNLRASDALVLPVNFDEESRRFVRYSLPTKVPEYLFSGVPVLVYGPENVAQVGYARDHGWGLVVNTRGVAQVSEAIRRLRDDPDLRRTLTATARRVGTANHDAAQVRARFRAVLAEAAEAP